ncbi:hypothetical protein AGR1A_Cc50177 [Agrobacterium fabacearum CFBP 5771]|nr:hypothetical protein AGR1A_Cc50177 [Agrobacterium fabacearum CFBP 5771]
MKTNPHAILSSLAHSCPQHQPYPGVEAPALPQTGTTLWSCPPLSRQPSVTPLPLL